MGLPAGTTDNDIALRELWDIRVNYFADRSLTNEGASLIRPRM
jgi:hypothetical protein